MVWMRQQSLSFEDEDDGGGGEVSDGEDEERIPRPSLRHLPPDVMSMSDAETVLLSLGFSDVDPVLRIPDRFSSPSQLKGIDTSFLLTSTSRLSSPASTTAAEDSISAFSSVVRDGDESLNQRNARSSLRRLTTASTQTSQDAGSRSQRPSGDMQHEKDIWERETLLTIILKSLQLSLDYYSRLLHEFLPPLESGENQKHDTHRQTQCLPSGHLSLAGLVSRISEEVSFIVNHLSLQREHLLFLLQDSVIHRMRHLSRRLRLECRRLLHVADLLQQESRDGSFTTSLHHRWFSR